MTWESHHLVGSRLGPSYEAAFAYHPAERRSTSPTGRLNTPPCPPGGVHFSMFEVVYFSMFVDNAKIQAAKRRACGFRNRARFRTAIYFHCGGLDLYPKCAWSGA